jgi:transcription-repair coupling factor (superfamily II helicase)
VRSIDHLREKLERIVPEARIVVAHGQMTPRQLERVMVEFAHGEHDVLLATSLIENGIDMPNVNTLIVDRADWFGMSQLYQLRGRVGRGAQQAYAYMFHKGGATLTEEARYRLETLAENTDLGAGFQIAMRDLELRGAGDILSTRQTGHVAAIGLHLYTQLLTNAVQTLKGKSEGETTPAAAQERIVIDLPVPAYIPTDWIPEMALRLQIYRRIGGLQTQTDIDLMREELRDRFGQLPAAVDGLLYQMEVKLLAQAIHATSITLPRQHILIKLPYLVAMDRERLAHELGDDVEVSRTAIELRAEPDIWRWRLLDVLKQLKAGLPESVGA